MANCLWDVNALERYQELWLSVWDFHTADRSLGNFLQSVLIDVPDNQDLVQYSLRPDRNFNQKRDVITGIITETCIVFSLFYIYRTKINFIKSVVLIFLWIEQVINMYIYNSIYVNWVFPCWHILLDVIASCGVWQLNRSMINQFPQSIFFH